MSVSASGVDPLPDDPEGLICSARGCRQPALYDVQWNNPKIHSADRRKHWLACDDHRESLGQFLSARGFLKDVLPL
ncbi:MAG TPA: acetone carboxylase [Propionibacteriaceae bacterium]|nr:acetone carboxylase [Propionibacteriaceae bacterium]